MENILVLVKMGWLEKIGEFYYAQFWHGDGGQKGVSSEKLRRAGVR